eukprot:746507-Hanusia_phi.AAC.1
MSRTRLALREKCDRSDERTRMCAPGNFKLAPFLTSNEDMKGKDPYNEGIKYKDIFKNGDKRPSGAPKQGFLSADFPKRDEYTNNMRTEQLRETLKVASSRRSPLLT